MEFQTQIKMQNIWGDVTDVPVKFYFPLLADAIVLYNSLKTCVPEYLSVYAIEYQIAANSSTTKTSMWLV